MKCFIKLAKAVFLPKDAKNVAFGNTVESAIGLFLTAVTCIWIEIEHRNIRISKDGLFWEITTLFILSSSLITDILLCFGVTKKNKCLCLAWLIVKPVLTVLAILVLALCFFSILPDAMRKWRGPTEEQFAFGTLLSLTLISLLHPIINIRFGFQIVFEFKKNAGISDHSFWYYFSSSTGLTLFFCLIPPLTVALLSYTFLQSVDLFMKLF